MSVETPERVSVAQRMAQFGESQRRDRSPPVTTTTTNATSKPASAAPVNATSSSSSSSSSNSSTSTSSIASTATPVVALDDAKKPKKKSKFMSKLRHSVAHLSHLGSLRTLSGNKSTAADDSSTVDLDDGASDELGGTTRKWKARLQQSDGDGVAHSPPDRPQNAPPRPAVPQQGSLNPIAWQSGLESGQLKRHSSHESVTPAPAPAPTVRKPLSDDEHRDLTLQELVSTEADYVRDLEILNTLFVQPLLDGEIISDAEHAQLFANVEQILLLNTNMLARLKAAKTATDVAQTFLALSDYLKSYSAYCSNQNKALELLQRLTDKSSEFSGFVEYCLARPEARGLTLAAFLVKPLQRVCKYPLLLRELVKRLPENGAEHKLMQLALDKIAATVAVINERQRDVESNEKLFAIFKAVECLPGVDILSPTRRFVFEDDAKIVGTATVEVQATSNVAAHWVCFNDAFLLCKTTKKKRQQMIALVPFESAGFRASLKSDTVLDVTFVSELKSWSLQFASADERDRALGDCLAALEKYLEHAVATHVAATRTPAVVPTTTTTTTTTTTPSPTPAPVSAAIQLPSPTAYQPMPARRNERPSAEVLAERERRATELQTRFATMTKAHAPHAASVAPLLPAAASSVRDDDDEASAAPAADGVIPVRGRHHDETIDLQLPRAEFTFANVRLLLHSAFHLTVPRPFVVIKHNGLQRVFNDADLLRAWQSSHESVVLELYE